MYGLHSAHIGVTLTEACAKLHQATVYASYPASSMVTPLWVHMHGRAKAFANMHTLPLIQTHTGACTDEPQCSDPPLRTLQMRKMRKTRHHRHAASTQTSERAAGPSPHTPQRNRSKHSLGTVADPSLHREKQRTRSKHSPRPATGPSLHTKQRTPSSETAAASILHTEQRSSRGSRGLARSNRPGPWIDPT